MMKASALLILLVFLTAGCAFGPESMLAKKNEKPAFDAARLQKESDQLAAAQAQMRRRLQTQAPQPIEVKPVMPAYDPLKDHMVSFAMVNEKLENVLYTLSQAVQMNLIIDPGVVTAQKRVTLNFQKVSAATFLNEILNSFDLYYEITQNIIRVKAYQERFFSLNFLDTNMTTSFDVGGDVLGAGETETAEGLTGSFKLTGSGSKKENPYDVLEEVLKQLKTTGGKYSLNRLSGSLYVKDTPNVIKAVSRLVNHYREMLDRQILIEARIIEVTLADEYKYGIDWSFLRDETLVDTYIGSGSWSLGSGMILSGITSDYSIETTIDALNRFGDTKVVSNPSIRSKHGKPAIISVGTSFTYKKSVETTSFEETVSGTRETTEVEVSNVFDGLILGVIPFIDAGGKITLLINPIKSDVNRESLEPEEIGPNADQSISLPEVSIKEISTTISLNSRDVVILGGLIDKRHVADDSGVPFFSALPGVGYLFKDELRTDETRELVIILSVTII